MKVTVLLQFPVLLLPVYPQSAIGSTCFENAVMYEQNERQALTKGTHKVNKLKTVW